MVCAPGALKSRRGLFGAAGFRGSRGPSPPYHFRALVLTECAADLGAALSMEASLDKPVGSWHQQFRPLGRTRWQPGSPGTLQLPRLGAGWVLVQAGCSHKVLINEQ